MTGISQGQPPPRAPPGILNCRLWFGRQGVEEEVIDYGTGSGVLATAAALLGAKHVTGVDVDFEILAHAKQNFLVSLAQPRCMVGSLLSGMIVTDRNRRALESRTTKRRCCPLCVGVEIMRYRYDPVFVCLHDIRQTRSFFGSNLGERSRKRLCCDVYPQTASLCMAVTDDTFWGDST